MTQKSGPLLTKSPVNVLHVLRIPFPKKTSGGLPLSICS